MARNPKHKPNFSKAFQHIAVHPGARIVVDRVATVRKAMQFPRSCVAAQLLSCCPWSGACRTHQLVLVIYWRGEKHRGLQNLQRVRGGSK